MLARKILINSRRQMSTYVQYMSKNLQKKCIETSYDVIKKPAIGDFVMLEQPIIRIQTPDERFEILSEYKGIVIKVYDFEEKINVGYASILSNIFGQIPLCEITDDSFGMDAICLFLDRKTRAPVEKITYA